MSRKLNNASWEEYINKFDSYISDSNAEEPTLEEITYKRSKKNHYI
ncbi:hypothetical protein [Clostridium sp.]|nr:hypothetical protein [Clostridium sp.]